MTTPIPREDRDWLFLRTIDDLRGRIQDLNPYDLVMLSGLLRKLVLDGGASLVNQVNRRHRLRLVFTIGDPDTPYRRLAIQQGLTFWTHQDGLDPDAVHPPALARRIEVDLKRLLSTELIFAAGRWLTVKDVILFQAHVVGGIHAGLPREAAKVLAAHNHVIVGGLPAAMRQILSIARVVNRGLAPLYVAVQRTFDSQNR